MNRLINFLLFVIFSASCNNLTNKSQTINFGNFNMQVPNNWKKDTIAGSDSSGVIKIDSIDFLYFGFLKHQKSSKELISFDTSNTFGYTIYPPLSALGDSNTVEYLTINGKKIEISSQNEYNNRITSLFIDSLIDLNGQIFSFNIYGKNLKPKNRKLVLKMFKSIKFKE